MAKGRAYIRDIDRGYNKVFREARLMGSHVLSVGLHQEDGDKPKELPDGQSHSGTPPTLATIASWHEFGVDKMVVDKNGHMRWVHVPKRSMVGDWFDIGRAGNTVMIRKVSTQVLQGKRSSSQALGLLGVAFQGSIQARMSKGIAPALSPSTVRRKTVGGRKGTTPLINTNQMRSNMIYQIDAKGAGK
jgi:hypothetical protein